MASQKIRCSLSAIFDEQLMRKYASPFALSVDVLVGFMIYPKLFEHT